jgi:hypothetical protein
MRRGTSRSRARANRPARSPTRAGVRSPPPSAPRPVFDRKAAFEATEQLVARQRPRSLFAESALAPRPTAATRPWLYYALYATHRPPRRGAGAHRALERPRRARPRRARRPRRSRRPPGRSRARRKRILGGLADVRPGDKEPSSVRLAGCTKRPTNTAARVPGSPRPRRHRARRCEPPRRCAALRGPSWPERAGRRDEAHLRLDAVRQGPSVLVDASPRSRRPAPVLAGDMQVSADWHGQRRSRSWRSSTPRDKRSSWMGAPAKVVATCATRAACAPRRSRLLGMPSGRYVVEVTRAGGRAGSAPVRGEITLTLNGRGRGDALRARAAPAWSSAPCACSSPPASCPSRATSAGAAASAERRRPPEFRRGLASHASPLDSSRHLWHPASHEHRAPRRGGPRRRRRCPRRPRCFRRRAHRPAPCRRAAHPRLAPAARHRALRQRRRRLARDGRSSPPPSRAEPVEAAVAPWCRPRGAPLPPPPGRHPARPPRSGIGNLSPQQLEDLRKRIEEMRSKRGLGETDRAPAAPAAHPPHPGHAEH